MATVNKNFRVKNGLVVEGATGTINDSDIITAEIIENGTHENIIITYDEEAKALSFVAENGVEDSTTDDLSEGSTNLYFTDDRVTDTLVDTTYVQWVNAIVSKEDGILTITAENGVDDSTTDDLEEGSTNLYFTEQRVLDAVSDALEDDYWTTDDLSEGTANLYFTDTRVYDKAKAIVSAGFGIDVTADDEAEELLFEVDTAEIATVEYVNEVAQGLKVRGNVEAATTENLIGTYDNGVNGVDATINLGPLPSFEVDGWSDWEVNDGILVKDQDDPIENGRYFIFQVGDETTDWILKRCIRCDESEEIPGSYVFVQHGTQYGATGWVATVDNLGTFTVGEDDINWVQFSGAGTYIGGTGIDIDGQEISIDFSEFDTDNVDEGSTNLYFTDQRVLDVIDTITTDEVDEGSTNLYFTDQRAVDALEAVIPNFTEIEINSLSKQVATTTDVTSPDTPTVVLSFSKSDYRSAKFLVKAAYGSHTQISEVLITMDTSDNVAITEYAIVSTNGILIEITAAEATGDVDLIVEAANATTEVIVFGTLIA